MTRLHPHQTAAQCLALAAAKEHFGALWKTELSRCWETGSYPVALRDHAASLQFLRNTSGPSALHDLKL